MNKGKFALLLVFLFSFYLSESAAQQNENSDETVLTLNQCIELTLKNNSLRNVSGFAVRAAEARVKQAKSGGYPKLDASAGYLLMDQNPNFLFPGMRIEVPPINMGTFSVAPAPFTVPDQNVTLADKQTISASLELLFPLYTGGKITSYIEQAEAGLEIAKNEARENDEQIILETKKIYYSLLLATKLESIAKEAVDRFTSTLKLTEATYKNGSGKVTKSDYLKNKTVTEAIKSIWIQIAGEKNIAAAALAHAIGFDWRTKIKISETDFPPVRGTSDLETLINSAVNQNPLFSKVENGKKVFEAKIDLAKSGRLPSVAMFGSYRKLFNSYDYGMMTPENKNVWMVGVGVQLNLFDGFLTSGLIEEADANLEKLNAQKDILTKGISMKVQYLFNKLKSSTEKENASREAMNAAVEDRDLVEKAYFNDIMELKDLIQAQLTESIMKAQYEMVRYEWVVLDAELQSVLAEGIKL